jgi:hypothetical protein
MVRNQLKIFQEGSASAGMSAKNILESGQKEGSACSGVSIILKIKKKPRMEYAQYVCPAWASDIEDIIIFERVQVPYRRVEEAC